MTKSLQNKEQPSQSNPIDIEIKLVKKRIQSGKRLRQAAISDSPAEKEYFIQHTQIGNMTLEDIEQLREDIRKILYKAPSPPLPLPLPTPQIEASTQPLRRSSRLSSKK